MFNRLIYLWILFHMMINIFIHAIFLGFKRLLFLAPPSPEGSDAAVHYIHTIYINIYSLSELLRLLHTHALTTVVSPQQA